MGQNVEENLPSFRPRSSWMAASRCLSSGSRITTITTLASQFITFGRKGYMDIAIAENSSSNAAAGYKLGPFTTLIVVPDPNEYDQANQRNYTAVVTLPNQDCAHCVIRARYSAHKPGETIFYQCADVKIKATREATFGKKRGELQLLGPLPTHSKVTSDQSLSGNARLRRLLALISSSAPTEQVKSRSAMSALTSSASVLHGLANHLDDPLSSVYCAIDSVTGEKKEVATLNFRVDSSFDPARLQNGSLYNGTTTFAPGMFSERQGIK
ncbi:hypothetical protein PoB_000982300 [Plakobranchus ocellatus]|uniref:Uncharacterized protein n=1 Tax=Plakobranchus ocellatus TaxID=259542 RepID=A0AAV3YM55_9GAST|nr:hypothetical protein PoB_000982300 [Plakobranchus ocellatus]